MSKAKRLHEFRRFIQSILDINFLNLGLTDIDKPDILILSPEKFDPPTMKACVSSNGKTLLVNDRMLELTPMDTVWVVSHECRHIWQYKNAPEIIENYVPRDAATDLTEYNLQQAEIDANAWACLVLGDLFHQRPLLENAVGEEVWAKIQERMKEIKKDFEND